MKKSTKKTILITTSVLALSASLFAAFGGNFNFDNVLKARSAGESFSKETITFSNCTKSGTTSISVGTTYTGGKVYCKVTGNDTSLTTSYIAAMKNGSELHFYEDSACTIEYTFEDVDSFSITKSDTTSYFGFNLNYLDESGLSGTFVWSAKKDKTRSPGFNGSGVNASQFSILCTTSYADVALIESLIITYNCSRKSISGISITNEPAIKKYKVGDAFNPTGMVVKANYDDGKSIATNSFTYSTSPFTSAGEQQVAISYAGYTVYQTVNVYNDSSTATLSSLLTSQNYIMHGILGSYDFEVTLNFSSGTANARRKIAGESTPYADLYSQTFSYAVDETNKTFNLTSAGTPTKTGESAIADGTSRLRQNGIIVVSILNNQIDTLWIMMYNKSGVSQGFIKYSV